MADQKPTTPFSPPLQDVAPRVGLTPAQAAQLAAQQAAVGQEAFIDPNITDPAALAYAAGAAARRSAKGALPKYQTPVADGPGPAIPPLEQPHQEGMTMEQQAAMYRQHNTAQQAAQLAGQPRGAGSIIESGGAGVGSMAAGAPKLTMPTPAQIGIQPGDMLPPEAQQDPNFRKGQGALVAASQPDMALKYGVVRNGMRIPPQALQANVGQYGGPSSGNRQLSQDSVRDLQALQGLQAAQQTRPEGMPRDEKEAEEQAAKSSAAASAHAGTPPKPGEATDKEVAAAIREMDDFDFDQLRRQLQEDAIRNPEQKRIIEGRLEPLDIDEIIMKDRVKQKVPIIPGRLVYTFLSMTGDDDLALKRLLMKESKSVEVTDQYLLEKFSFMAVACGLYAINNNVLPSHLGDDGEFDDKKFWEKFRWVLKRPLHMLGSIGANHSWFETRVRKLFTAEKVGNG